MYRVEFYCPRQAPFWQSDPENPFWILANAIRRCNSWLMQVHRNLSTLMDSIMT